MRTVLCRTALFLGRECAYFWTNHFLQQFLNYARHSWDDTVSIEHHCIGSSGTISNVNVRLKGFTHQFPNGLDLLLVGPGRSEIHRNVGFRSCFGGVEHYIYTVRQRGDSLAEFTEGTPGPIQNNTTYRPTDSSR